MLRHSLSLIAANSVLSVAACDVELDSGSGGWDQYANDMMHASSSLTSIDLDDVSSGHAVFVVPDYISDSNGEYGGMQVRDCGMQRLSDCCIWLLLFWLPLTWAAHA